MEQELGGGGVFLLVELKSFLGTRAGSLDMSLNNDCP